MSECNGTFYSRPNILARMGRNLLAGRNPFFSLVSNLSSRRNSALYFQAHRALWPAETDTADTGTPDTARVDLVETWETVAQRVGQLAVFLKMQVAGLFRQS